MLPFACPALKI